jgi:hypothetical protein
VNPGTFDQKTKRLAGLLALLVAGLRLNLDASDGVAVSDVGHIPMTMSLVATSSYCTT